MKKTFFSFLLSSQLFSFHTSYDLNLSPKCGSENLTAIHYNIERADKYLLEKIKDNPPGDWKAFLICGIERWLELSFIWDPLNSYLNVVQHEFFGHGYRIRDLGQDIATIKKYKIYKPYPFGSGGGYTSYEYKKITPFHESAISIAGTEATSIFARELKMNWLNEGAINPLQASLYLESVHDLTIYTLITKKHELFSDDGNDIASYIISLLLSYEDCILPLKKLKKGILINFLDPFTYLSAYSYFKYIFTGKETSIPMIPIKNFRFLPSGRIGLAPYGPELYFENFISSPIGPIYLYFKQGHYWKNSYFGLGFQAPCLLKKTTLPVA